MTDLKYKMVFAVRPEAVVKVAREMSRESYKHQFAFARAMRLLGDLGVSGDDMKRDVLNGHIDLISDEQGEIFYVDHRISKEVMTRLTEK
jgi:hypothetical protein